MANRYFKKPSPGTKVVLPDGRTGIAFATIDGFSGYFATGNSTICEYFLDCMKKNRYGITEIAQAEYEEWAKKKASSSPFRQPWREEMGASGVTGRAANAQGTVAVKPPGETPSANRLANSADAQAVVAEARPAQAPTAPVKPVFKPPTGRRKAKTTA